MATSHSVANAAVNSSFLSQADDLCSRILLDIMVFAEDKVDGRRTGKMNKRDVREMRLKESDLKLTADVVQQLRDGTMTASDAGNKLASTAYYKTFVNTWDDDDEDLFLNHVKRYCHAFRPDSGIAFHETNRYTGSAVPKSAAARQTPSPTPPPATSTRSPATFIEVGVFATRAFKKGEIINLRGGVADLSEEEDDKMREGGGRSDFSVLWSARKKCFGLLLGPARFVNHDCRNNVQFHLTGSNMAFKVIEDIKADEELFTHYGEHYFDTDNAACLCATCQKLKRGAFTPKSVLAAAKRAAAAAAAPAAGDAPESPARRSGNGGHEVTAQRSVGRPTRSRSSTADEDKRRSERTSLPIDTLRVGDRHVHPRMAPPPLYSNDYEWDSKNKVAKYIGLVHVPTVHKAKPKGKTSTPSASDSAPSTPNKTAKVALGKRKRAESRSESPAFSASTPRPVKKKVVAKRMVVLKKATPGSRSSSRAAAGQGSASARSRSFDKLKLAMGGGESDDELTDLSSSDEDQGDEIDEKVAEAVGDNGRPVIVVHVKAVEGETHSVANDEMLVDIVAPEDGVKSPDDAEDAQEVAALLLADPVGSMAPESPYEEPQPTPTPAAEPVKDEPLSDSDGFSARPPRRSPSPRPTSPHVDPPPRQPPPISATPGPIDAEAQPSQATDWNGTSTTSNTNDTTSGSASAMSSFCDSRSSIGGGAAGGAAGGSGGDDGEERRNGREHEKVDEEMRMVEEVSMMDLDEEVGRFVKEEEDVVEEAPLSAAPSEGGARDEDTAEAAAFLLMLKNTPTIEPAATSSSSVAPPENAPSPPKPGSSAASVSSSVVEPADAQAKKVTSTKMAKKRSRQSLEIEPHLANNPRSTRRNSQLEEPSPPPIALPSPTSAAPRQPKPMATTSRPSSQSRSPRPSDPTTDRKPSRPSPLGALARSSGSPMEGVESTGSSRGTRLSAPIAGKLADILKDPAVMSVAGGFDPIANRYVARGRVSEGPEWLPAPLPEPAAPLFSPSRPATAPVPTTTPATAPASSPAPRPPRPRPVSLHNGDLRRFVASPKERRSSFGATPSTSKLPPSINSGEPSTSPSSRSTRRSAPIEGSVADLIASPAVSAVAGGFDPESGKYTSTRRVVATSTSLNGTPVAKSASPDTKLDVELPRGTRSRAPIAGTVAQLVASREVSAVSGGWNPETGRYTGIRKRGGGAGSPPAPEPRA